MTANQQLSCFRILYILNNFIGEQKLKSDSIRLPQYYFYHGNTVQNKIISKLLDSALIKPELLGDSIFVIMNKRKKINFVANPKLFVLDVKKILNILEKYGYITYEKQKAKLTDTTKSFKNEYDYGAFKIRHSTNIIQTIDENNVFNFDVDYSTELSGIKYTILEKGFDMFKVWMNLNYLDRQYTHAYDYTERYLELENRKTRNQENQNSQIIPYISKVDSIQIKYLQYIYLNNKPMHYEPSIQRDGRINHFLNHSKKTLRSGIKYSRDASIEFIGYDMHASYMSLAILQAHEQNASQLTADELQLLHTLYAKGNLYDTLLEMILLTGAKIDSVDFKFNFNCFVNTQRKYTKATTNYLPKYHAKYIFEKYLKENCPNIHKVIEEHLKQKFMFQELEQKLINQICEILFSKNIIYFCIHDCIYFDSKMETNFLEILKDKNIKINFKKIKQ